MWNLIANFVAYYIFLESIFSEGYVYKECPSGYCPVVQAKKTDYLSGRWECGVCGNPRNHAKNTVSDCYQVFDTFEITSEDKCSVKSKYCSSMFSECLQNKTSRCQEVYRTTGCCICKENVYGWQCTLPRVLYIASTIKRGVGEMVDLSNRPECWAVFVHHTHHWKSQILVSYVLVPWMERINKLPFNIFVRDHLLNYIFTKFNTRIVKNEFEHWCLTSTTLREYCQRLYLIFNPKFNIFKEQVRYMIYFEKEFTFETTYTNEINNQLDVYRRKEYTIGYVETTNVYVFPFTLLAPYYRYLVFHLAKVELSHSTKNVFNNQTGVDGKCVPDITQLCQTVMHRSRTYPYWALTFKMEYHSPPDDCVESSVAQWRVFEKKPDISYRPGDEIIYREGCCSISFPPFTFKIGTYFIKFTMMHIEDGRKIYNSRFCLKPIYNDKIAAYFYEDVKLVNTEDLNTVEVNANDINNRPKDQKKNLVYIWTCTFNGNSDHCAETKGLFGKTSNFGIPPKTLKVNSTYNFSVDIYSTTHIYGIQDNTNGWAYQVLEVTTRVLNFISLICTTCNNDYVVNPEENNVIMVRAKDRVSPPFPSVYDWSYAEFKPNGVLGEFHPVEAIRTSGTDDIVLKIKKNALGYNKIYVFKAERRNSTVYARLRISTPQLKTTLQCVLDPMEGIQGWTDFNVDCPIENEALFFEFYDKEENDELIFNGRMVGYNDEGVLKNFKMTKSKFFAVAFDRNSLIRTFSLNVTLYPYNDTVKYLEGLISKTRDYLETDQFDWPSATVSSVATVTVREMKPSTDLVQKPIFILHEVRLGYEARPKKMLLSSLKVVLTNIAGKFSVLEQIAYLTYAATETLSTVSDHLLQCAVDGDNDPTLTHTVYYQVFKAVLDCAEILLRQRNWEYVNETEDYTRPFVADLVQQTSLMLVSVLETVSYTLITQQIMGDQPEEVVSDKGKLVAKTKVDFAGVITEWTTVTENCSVVVHNESISFARYQSAWEYQVLKLQFIRILINPFWWADGDVVSEVLLVNICKETEKIVCLNIVRFSSFVTLYLPVIEPLNHIIPLEGTAYQVNPKISEEQKELELTVYRIFLPKRAKLYLKFLLNGTEEFRVMLVEGLRPEYETMVKHSIVINANSSEYFLPYVKGRLEAKTYYMGILPSASVSVGERTPFRLRVYYVLCNNWMRWKWSSYGCWVGEATTEASIHCSCDRLLSVVAGIMTVPDHNLSQVSEFLLYLTVWENFVPLVVLLVVLLLYLLLLIWSVLADKKDLRSGEVIILEDNFPGEPYAYLVGVRTGSRLNSGTSAKVGVILCGLLAQSRPHVLSSPDRRVLRGFSEDWFLIFTQRHLGKLRSIWLWHHDEGVNPDWFVETIEVHDLREKLQYIFYLNTWLSLEVNTYPEIFTGPMKFNEYFSASNVFHSNFEDGMRDSQNWTSVIFKHPRNPVSRVERASILAVFVLSEMAVCLLLFISHFGFHIDEDKPSFYLDTTDLVIFAISWTVASSITGLVEGLFRKSLTHRYKFSPHIIRTSRFSDGTDDKSSILKNKVPADDSLLKLNIHEKLGREKSTCDRLTLALYEIVRGSSLLPVRLPNTKSDLIVRKPWFFTAWTVCIITILVSLSFIVLCVWRLPTVKNEKFLTVFLGIIFFDAFIYSPLKILIISGFLSIVFRNILPHTTYHIKINDAKRWQLYGDETFLANLLETRKQRAYRPLKELEKEMKRQKKIRRYRLRILIEFGMDVILVCVISASFSFTYVQRYTSNMHANRIMTMSQNTRIPNLLQVFNRTQLFLFLEKTYVNRLHSFMWYNYDSLTNPNQSRREWTSDCVTRLMGDTRIRQVRVSTKYCRVSDYFNSSIGSCAPPWSSRAEDKDVYSLNWQRGGYEDAALMKSAWKYTDAEDSNSSRAWGESGTLYDAGGYIAETGLSKRDARYTLHALNVQNWLGHLTRAVFIELTLYNVNSKLFTQVVLACEQHPSGLYLSLPNVESVNINLSFDFWNVGFVVFQIYFLFRTFYFMNRHGIFEYFSNFMNCWEVLLLVIGFLSLLVYIAHLISSSLYVDEYHRKGLYEFFNFDEILRFDEMFKRMMIVLFLCAVMKLLLSWRFGHIYYVFYYTFHFSLPWIVWVTFYFTICVVIPWRLASYRLNVYTFSHYSTLIIYSNDLKLMDSQLNWMECLLIGFVCLMSCFVITFFIASFIHFYRVSRFYKPYSYKEIEHFSFSKFYQMDAMRLIEKGKRKSSIYWRSYSHIK